MSGPTWMPLHVKDYRADTGHLSAAEHGAYLLLIMHYWQTGGLPDDDVQLARIACMTPSEWRRARPIVSAFFADNWRHKRIDQELARAADLTTKRRAAANVRYSKNGSGGGSGGQQGGSKKRPNAHANAGVLQDVCSADAPHSRALHPQIQEQTYPVADATAHSAPPDPAASERDLFRRGRAVFGANAGGLIANLLRSKGGNVALARADIERASQAEDPREFIGRILSPKPYPKRQESPSAARRDLWNEALDEKLGSERSARDIAVDYRVVA